MLYKLATALISLSLLAAACSDSGSVSTVVLPSTTTTAGPTTTIDPDQAIVFGSGSLPETMPADFPIPAEAVIGSTLVDRNRNLTEVVLRVPSGVEALAAFFEANLPGRDYSIGTSSGDATRWDVELTGPGVSGTITITLGGQDVSQAVIRVTAEA